MNNNGAVFRKLTFLPLILLILLMTIAFAEIQSDMSGNRILQDLICPAGGNVSLNNAGTMLRSSIGQTVTGKSENPTGFVLYHGAHNPVLPSLEQKRTSAKFYDYL